MSVVVHDEDALYGATHAKVFIVILKTLQAGRHRGVFLGLSFLGTNKGEWRGVERGARTNLNVKLERG